MIEFNSLAVNLGSNFGFRPEYRLAAENVGRELATRQIRLIYGGARVGLMGVLADSALACGGAVTGVIPDAIADKIGHSGLTSLERVPTMHQRKARMAELADGFVVLPGGSGTLEELFEVLTWAQLGFHEKPIGLLNVAGYFNPLLSFLDATVTEGFMRQEHRQMLIVATEIAPLLSQMSAYQPTKIEKWLPG